MVISEHRTLHIPYSKRLGWLALAAIVVLAAALRLLNLSALGLANHYYSAAVASMLQSWHNFFFVAAEPGGSVSVDKPPLGLWFQAISAYFLGVNGFAMLLPQIIAGVLSVLLVYYLVRRSFGTVAGLLAALALAITPVVVATDRNNTIDSTLILTLLLAAWAFIKATEQGRLRYLLLGTTLVGLGFNIKMLAAFLPLPAFYALYLLGSAERLGRKLLNLVLASLLLLVVSLSWAVAVDLTPANERPYVGSSGDNSVLSLAIGYNGVQRLLGMGGGRPGAGLGRFPGERPEGNWRPEVNWRAREGYGWQPAQGGAIPPAGFAPGNPPGGPGVGGMFPPPGAERSFPGNSRPPGGGPGGGGPGGGGPGNGMDTGRVGVLRLFTAPLSNEMSWLLPFGLFSLVMLVCSARLHWPVAAQYRTVLLWGGWLVTGAVFFSIAGFFHPYYLSIIAPPLAALVGIGAVEIWRLRQERPRLALVLILVAVALTLGLQVVIARSFERSTWWLWLACGLFIGGALILLAATIKRLPRGAITGYGCLLAAMLLTPGIWSALTVYNSSQNQSLPAAYTGRSAGPANQGGVQVDQALLAYLEQHTQDVAYLMAVPSSMQGADYVLATGRPVLYLGGFMGQDKVLTSDELAQLVANGVLRYIYWNGRDAGPNNQSEISSWVTAHCQAVSGFDAATRNAGAPDGISTGQPPAGNGFPGGGDMQVSLYECGG
jgi:4-amino-4-deoxy-L-arabinose transferase-like glycosyltransferase